jgi:putative hydrolase of the HAD superfamily
MTRAVIFDLDDTLYPYDAFVASGFRAVADHLSSAVGVEADVVHDALSRARLDTPGQELQALVDLFGWPHEWVPRLRDVVRFHRPCVELWPDARHALRQLRISGWRLAILTNGRPAIQQAKVRALGVAASVDAVVYAECCAPGGKPAREAFDHVVARLRVERDRTVMVGDDVERDVRGAMAAGLHAVHVRRGPRASSAAGSAPEVSTIDAACALVERMVPNRIGRKAAPEPSFERLAWSRV